MRYERPTVYWWQKFIQRITAMGWAARFMTHRLHHWDEWVHKITRGRWTATEILSGLPVIFVNALGARSGERRTTPLLAIRDGEKFILVATKFGADRHPDWYYNIIAHPKVDVLYKGQISSYVAEELEGDARQAAWDRAVTHYPGYQAYEQRACNRIIPVLALHPNSSS